MMPDSFYGLRRRQWVDGAVGLSFLWAVAVCVSGCGTPDTMARVRLEFACDSMRCSVSLDSLFASSASADSSDIVIDLYNVGHGTFYVNRHIDIQPSACGASFVVGSIDAGVEAKVGLHRIEPHDHSRIILRKNCRELNDVMRMMRRGANLTCCDSCVLVDVRVCYLESRYLRRLGLSGDDVVVSNRDVYLNFKSSGSPVAVVVKLLKI
jgi:hypothetical protein